MKVVTLDSLTCVNAPLNSPLDCQVSVWLDGAALREPYLLAKTLQTGESKPPAAPFTRTYYIDTSIRFELVTGQSLSLGEHTVAETESAGTYTETFTSGQVEFELEFTLTEPTASHDPLAEAVGEFRTGKSTANSDQFSRWNHLSHTDVVDRVEFIAMPPADADSDAIPDIYEVDQASTGYCGMAAIAFSLALRQPRRFVEFCRSMYEAGGFLGRTIREETSQTIQNSPVGDGLDDLEWLLLGSLRESENFIEDVSSEDLNGGASTLELRYWLEELLGYENATWHSAQVAGERDALDAASTAFSNGGIGILHVHKEWLSNKVLNDPEQHASSWSRSANHFVAMGDAVTVFDEGDPDSEEDDELLFDVHTWGDRKFIDMEWQYIHEYLFGSIVGWPT